MEIDRLGQLLVVQPGRQGHKHHFKECKECKGEIHALWERVGSISGERNGLKERGKDTLKSRKVFGCGTRKYNARPSNTSIEGLLGKEEFAEAALTFPSNTRCV